MFGAMTPKNPIMDPALKRLFEVSFDDALRESVRSYLGRECMSRTRFGRTVLGDPHFVDKRLNGGGSVTLDTADRIRDFVGEMPFRRVFCWEVEAFLVLTGLKPWAVGYQSVCQPSFVERLRAGASPYLSTVDRVRGWMRRQVRPKERQEILAAVSAAISCPAGAEPGLPPDFCLQGVAPMNGHPILLNTEEAAAWLGLSPRTLQCYRIRGEGPRFKKIGRWVRYAESDLEAWLAECTRVSTSDNKNALTEEAQ